MVCPCLQLLLLLLLHLSTYRIASTLRLDVDHHTVYSPSLSLLLLLLSWKLPLNARRHPNILLVISAMGTFWKCLNEHTEPPPPPSFSHSSRHLIHEITAFTEASNAFHSFAPRLPLLLPTFIFLQASSSSPPIGLHLHQHFSLIAKSSDLLQTSL